MTGVGPGEGYNINVPWEQGGCGDADYFAAWDYILIPVAKEFNPDMIIISAGFDAAVNDPLGGCCVSPYGYSVMLRKLMDFAQGKVVLALEGGYNLESLANSVRACVQALLEEKPISVSARAYPKESTWRVIENVRQKLRVYWPCLSKELPKKSSSQKTPNAALKDAMEEYIKSKSIVSEQIQQFKSPSEQVDESLKKENDVEKKRAEHEKKKAASVLSFEEELKRKEASVRRLREELISLVKEKHPKRRRKMDDYTRCPYPPCCNVENESGSCILPSHLPDLPTKFDMEFWQKLRP